VAYYSPYRDGTTQFDHGECGNDGQNTQIGDSKRLKVLGNLLTQVQRFNGGGSFFGSPGRASRRRLEQGNGTQSQNSTRDDLLRVMRDEEFFRSSQAVQEAKHIKNDKHVPSWPPCVLKSRVSQRCFPMAASGG
jgi:hypothetical protein